jgi:hypothetical protein
VVYEKGRKKKEFKGWRKAEIRELNRERVRKMRGKENKGNMRKGKREPSSKYFQPPCYIFNVN